MGDDRVCRTCDPPPHDPPPQNFSRKVVDAPQSLHEATGHYRIISMEDGMVARRKKRTTETSLSSNLSRPEPNEIPLTVQYASARLT